MEHIPQVKAIAIRVHENLPVHVDLDDLIHAGILGLFDAADKYDPAKNVAFSAYSKHRVKGAMLDSLRQLDWASRDTRRRHKGIENVRHELIGTLQREPTDEEVRQKLGVEVERWKEMMVELRFLGEVSGSTRTEQYDDLPDPDFPGRPDNHPDEITQKLQARAVLSEAMKALPERYQKIILLYYVNEMTMKEIGDVIGINESRVSQIHKSAMEKMNSFLRERGIEGSADLLGKERTSRYVPSGPAMRPYVPPRTDNSTASGRANNDMQKQEGTASPFALLKLHYLEGLNIQKCKNKLGITWREFWRKWTEEMNALSTLVGRELGHKDWRDIKKHLAEYDKNQSQTLAPHPENEETPQAVTPDPEDISSPDVLVAFVKALENRGTLVEFGVGSKGERCGIIVGSGDQVEPFRYMRDDLKKKSKHLLGTSEKVRTQNPEQELSNIFNQLDAAGMGAVFLSSIGAKGTRINTVLVVNSFMLDGAKNVFEVPCIAIP